MKNLKTNFWLPLLVAILSGISIFIFKRYFSQYEEQSREKIKTQLLFEELSGGTPISKIGDIIPIPDRVEELPLRKIYRWIDNDKGLRLNCSINNDEETFDEIYLKINHGSHYEIVLNGKKYTLGKIKLSDIINNEHFKVYIETPFSEEQKANIIATTINQGRFVDLESEPVDYKGRNINDYNLNTIFYSAHVLPLKNEPLNQKQEDYTVLMKAKNIGGEFYRNPIYGKWQLKESGYRTIKGIESFYVFNPYDEKGHYYYKIIAGDYLIEFYAPFDFEYPPQLIADTIRLNYGKFQYSLSCDNKSIAKELHTAAKKIEMAYSYSSKLFEIEFFDNYSSLDIYTDNEVNDKYVEKILNLHSDEYSKIPRGY